MIFVVIFTSMLHFLVGELLYVRNTLLGKSQPNRVTFFLWAFIPAIAIAAGLSAGETWSLLPVFMVGFGPFLISLASFWNPRAYWKLGTFDYTAGVLALLAIVLWLLIDEPATAVFFSILADGFAGLPTLIKAWKHPETETGVAYAFATLNAIVGSTLVVSYDFTNFGFLAYTVAINFCLAFFVYRKNLLQKLRTEFSTIEKEF